MAEHEPCIGATDDWYTPPDIFDALGLIFDLDPCSPGPAHWVPARKIYTKEDDGLVQPWSGTVFMNSAVWPAQWPCALATQVPRAQRWRRDCARVHEQRMVSPMGCEGANNVLPARQDSSLLLLRARPALRHHTRERTLRLLQRPLLSLGSAHHPITPVGICVTAASVDRRYRIQSVRQVRFLQASQ